MKKILLVLLSLISFCYGQTVNIGVLTGPSGIPMAQMMEETKSINGTKIQYEIFSGANLELPKLIKNELQIGFLPVNTACKVFNTNKKIVSAAICGNQMVSLITKDTKIDSISSINGKNIYVAGMGATPDFLTQFLLKKNNISAELNYSIPAPQLAAALIENKIEYAIVPEPFATIAVLKDKNIHKAIQYKNEFDEELPMTVLVINSDFAKNNKKFIQKFLSEYKKALNKTIKNPLSTGKLTEKNNLGLNAELTAKAIPDCEWTFISGKEQKEKVESLLKILEGINKSSYGEFFPSDEFYFE